MHISSSDFLNTRVKPEFHRTHTCIYHVHAENWQWTELYMRVHYCNFNVLPSRWGWLKIHPSKHLWWQIKWMSKQYAPFPASLSYYIVGVTISKLGRAFYCNISKSLWSSPREQSCTWEIAFSVRLDKSTCSKHLWWHTVYKVDEQAIRTLSSNILDR